MSMFVRLKRHNGKQHVLRRYTVFGIKFEESKGWYEVQDDVGAYCKTVKQVQDSPDSQYSAAAFDVVDTIEEARGLDAAERKKAERKLADEAERVTRPQNVTGRGNRVPASRATPGGGALTTSDLNAPLQPAIKKGDSFDDQEDTFPEDGTPLNPAPNRVIKTVETEDVGEPVESITDAPVVETATTSSKAPKKAK